jgi:hypothetical protein
MVSQLSQDARSHISHEVIPGAFGEDDPLVAFPDPDDWVAVIGFEDLDLWTGPAFRAKGELLRYLHGYHLLSVESVNLAGHWKVKNFLIVPDLIAP